MSIESKRAAIDKTPGVVKCLDINETIKDFNKTIEKLQQQIIEQSTMIEKLQNHVEDEVRKQIDKNKSLIRELKYAVEYRDYAKVKSLVEQKVDIHDNFEYVLRHVAGHGDLNMVKYFIDQGADINCKDENVLLSSILWGDNKLETMKYLFSKDLNIENSWGRANNFSSLDLDVIYYLTERIIEYLNKTNKLKSPFFQHTTLNEQRVLIAIYQDDIKSVQKYLEKSSYKNILFKKLAVWKDKKEIFKYLIDNSDNNYNDNNIYITDSIRYNNFDYFNENFNVKAMTYHEDHRGNQNNQTQNYILAAKYASCVALAATRTIENY